MAVPTLHLYVAPELGPLDVPTSGDWIDLSDRLRGMQLDRGRPDQYGKFQAASLTAVLDNSDRELDPQNPDGLVPWDSDIGMPLCPVKAEIEFNGTTYPLAGRMFLGPEAWRPTDPDAGTEATVLLKAMDAVGLFANLSLTDGLWSQVVAGIAPNLWIRGNLDGVTWDNEMDGGATYGGVGGGTVTMIPPLLPPESGEVDGVGWTLSPGAELEVSEAFAFPAGTVNDSTYCVIWRAGSGATAIGSPGDQSIATVYDYGTSRYRWRLDAPIDGTLRLRFYDSGGSVTSTLIAAGMWCDQNPHTIAVVIDGGVRCSLWVDGVRRATATTGIPAQSYDGVLITGGAMTAGYGRAFDEVIWLRRAITNDEATVLTGFVVNPNLFRGDSLATRIERFYDIAGWTIQSGESAEWHPAPTVLSPYYDYSSTGYIPLWGVAELGSLPTTLAGALSDLADGVGGDLYTLRSGRVRIRSILAVEDSTRAASYSTLRLHLTDEPSPTLVTGAPVTRRSQPQRTGSRLDRVINISDVSHGVPDDDGTIKPVVHRETNATSVARYGKRAVSQALLTQGEGMAKAIAARNVDRYGKPPIEMESVTIDLTATGYPTTSTTYLLLYVDLERAVRISYTPPGGGDVITRDTQVQGETWNWNPTTGLTVALDLAQS